MKKGITIIGWILCFLFALLGIGFGGLSLILCLIAAVLVCPLFRSKTALRKRIWIPAVIVLIVAASALAPSTAPEPSRELSVSGQSEESDEPAAYTSGFGSDGDQEPAPEEVNKEETDMEEAPEAESEADSVPELEAQSELETDSEAEPEPELEPEPEPEPEPALESESEPVPAPEAETESEAKSAPTPTPTSDPLQKTVYITDTGTKYHASGCRYLDQSKHAISEDDAIRQGYEACKVCKP